MAGPSRTTATSKAARYLQKRGSLLQSAASTQEGLSVLATNGWELSPRETLRRREHGAEQGKPPWQISIKTEQPFRVERPGSGTRRPLSNQSMPGVTGGATFSLQKRAEWGYVWCRDIALRQHRTPWQISNTINTEQSHGWNAWKRHVLPPKQAGLVCQRWAISGWGWSCRVPLSHLTAVLVYTRLFCLGGRYADGAPGAWQPAGSGLPGHQHGAGGAQAGSWPSSQRAQGTGAGALAVTRQKVGSGRLWLLAGCQQCQQQAAVWVPGRGSGSRLTGGGCVGTPIHACRLQQVHQAQHLQPYYRTSHISNLQQHLLWPPTQHSMARPSQGLSACQSHGSACATHFAGVTASL